MLGVEKIVIPMSGGGRLILCNARASIDDVNTESHASLPRAWRGQLSEKPIPPIQVKDNGELRLVETYQYEWAYEQEDSYGVPVVETPLASQRNWQERKRKGRPPEGAFQVVNFLGSSYLKFRVGTEEERIGLEFISKKIDFDTEYRQMTEDIARFCEQLLLSVNAPTSLRFSAEPTEQKRLLIESFFFLRHLLNDDSFRVMMEHIQRNPHRVLMSEREWRPTGRLTSADHLQNPNAMLREWRSSSGRRVAAEGVQVTRRETFDTPVNQFVLFTLRSFRKLVEDVLSLDQVGSSIQREATGMAHLLDAMTSQPFFKEISRLQKLPLNNQTLQKREGYRDVLRAWILVESASSLSWDGRKECYSGDTRNVATLYEYWLFLELHKILDNITGMVRHTDHSAEGFIKESNGELTVNLKSGKHSCSRFIYHPERGKPLHVSLHYELTFTENKVATSGKSYSRQFRPDYTLAMYSSDHASEKEATEKGAVRHLHFDAKYRLSSWENIAGKRSSDEAIHEEKEEEKSRNSYQRGDLLKMHTYNDALRKTIGSYVLYPGDDEKGQTFQKFNEIAPGVGAYVMKPGRDDCSGALQAFIESILEHQCSQFTQFNYLDETGHSVYTEAPVANEETSLYNVARPNAKGVMLWIKKERQQLFREQGFAYCRAIYNNDFDQSISLDLSTEVGSEFIPIEGTASTRELIGWRAKITGARFISEKKLEAYFLEKTGEEMNSKSAASHYILYEFSNDADIPRRDVGKLYRRKADKNKFMAVSCTWNEILECSEIL